MIAVTNKQCELERVKVLTFTRSLKLARVETLGSTRCSSYHNYYEPKVLKYFNSALNKLVLNFLEFQFVVNIINFVRIRLFISNCQDITV